MFPPFLTSNHNICFYHLHQLAIHFSFISIYVFVLLWHLLHFYSLLSSFLLFVSAFFMFFPLSLPLFPFFLHFTLVSCLLLFSYSFYLYFLPWFSLFLSLYLFFTAVSVVSTLSCPPYHSFSYFCFISSSCQLFPSVIISFFHHSFVFVLFYTFSHPYFSLFL